MLQDLRLNEGLTRQELANRLNRSVNYIVKAEQLTFPTLPPAFIDYYSHSTTTDAEILKDAYRDAQRRKREEWLDYYIPLPPSRIHLTFRRRWMHRNSPLPPDPIMHPTEYALSKGLCIPAAAVYRTEKDGIINQSIKDALSDLVDYCVSGRFHEKFGYDDESYEHIKTIVRMKQEFS